MAGNLKDCVWNLCSHRFSTTEPSAAQKTEKLAKLQIQRDVSGRPSEQTEEEIERQNVQRHEVQQTEAA